MAPRTFAVLERLGEGDMDRVNAVVQPTARRDRRFVRALGWVFVGLALSTAGCVSSSSDDSGPTCNQECVDENTAYGILETIRFLYNQNIANQGTAFTNKSAACPLGGSVTINGTVSGSSDFTNVLDLNYAMVSCANALEGYFDLAFTGAIDQNGTFNDVFGTDARTYASAALGITGTASSLDVEVAESCAVNIALSDSAVNGSICGRSFSY